MHKSFRQATATLIISRDARIKAEFLGEQGWKISMEARIQNPNPYSSNRTIWKSNQVAQILTIEDEGLRRLLSTFGYEDRMSKLVEGMSRALHGERSAAQRERRPRW